jgi:hypothetical protein
LHKLSRADSDRVRAIDVDHGPVRRALSSWVLCTALAESSTRHSQVSLLAPVQLEDGPPTQTHAEVGAQAVGIPPTRGLMTAPRGLVLSHQTPRLGVPDAGTPGSQPTLRSWRTSRLDACGGRLDSAISQPPRSGWLGRIRWGSTTYTSSTKPTRTGYGITASTTARYGGPEPSDQVGSTAQPSRSRRLVTRGSPCRLGTTSRFKTGLLRRHTRKWRPRQSGPGPTPGPRGLVLSLQTPRLGVSDAGTPGSQPTLRCGGRLDSTRAAGVSESTPQSLSHRGPAG